MKRFLCRLPFAYLLFKFRFNFISNTFQIVITAILILLYIFYNKKYWSNLKKFKVVLHSFIFYLILALLALSSVIIHGSGDYTYVSVILKCIFMLLSWNAFIIHIMKIAKGNDLKNILTDEYCKIMIFYMLFTIICLIFPSFKDWWLSLTLINSSDYERNLFTIEAYASRMSWDGFAGFDATFSCCLGVAFCLSCLDDNSISSNYEVLSRRRLYFYITLMLMGNVMYGRIGIISSMSMIAFVGIMEVIKYGKTRLLITVLFIVIAGLFIINILKDKIDMIGTIYKWSFEPFLNYLNGKGFTSSSSSELRKMYLQAEMSIKTIIVGDGYDIHVDSGFLGFVFFWGIFPTMLVYFEVYKTLRKTVFSNFNSIVILIIMTILFEIKGEIVMRMLYITNSIALLGSNSVSRKKIKSDIINRFCIACIEQKT